MTDVEGRKEISGKNRSGMRKEKDNVWMTGIRSVPVRKGRRERTDMGHSDIRQMAQSAQLCLHYSHCSSKNRHETKVKPAARCMSAGESGLSV